MSQTLLPAFRFATEAQWNSCLFVGADRQTAEVRTGMRPFAPYAVPALLATHGANAPTISETNDLLWRDDDGLLQRLPHGEDLPFGLPAPSTIAAAARLVAAPGALWALSAAGLLQAFDADSLSRLFAVDFPGEQVLDIAADGHGGLYALIGSSGTRRITAVNGAGRATSSFALDALPDASALVFLLRSARIIVLAEGSSRLHWLDPESGTLVSTVMISSLRPCFDPVVIGSDGCTRLFIAGTDRQPAGGSSHVLIVEAGGDLLGTVAFDGEPTGLVADRTHLHVTTATGLLRFDPAAAVPLAGGEVRADLLTPGLESSAETPQRWTRIEADVELPTGCSIEISYATGADKNARDQLTKRLADRSVPPRQRLDHWHHDLEGPRTFIFHGQDSKPGETSTFAVPLHDVRDPYLWVQVALIASPSGRMPLLPRLSVHYPGPALIDNLPAIYRRGEFETGNFLRSLVGVLEATTQDLDARIGDLGRNIHPQTAPSEWLDFVARWMGLPWDDSLSLDQKRRIVGHGAALSGGHGTRAGLALLLDSLLPERPRRFRIVDLMADYGLVTLGGGQCLGSRLPALLAGLPRTATELGNKAILGMARLPCTEPENETARLIGRIRIDLAVDATEYRDWSPWLKTLVDSMLPAAALAELRWLGRSAFAASDELSDGHSIGDDPLAHLGTDAVTGLARLAGRERTALPGQILKNSSLH